MNKNIVEGLIELGIFDAKFLNENDYTKMVKHTNNDKNTIYIQGDYGGRQVDTKGLSVEEIQLLLDINKTQNISSIKKMVVFFVVLTLINIILAIWSCVSIISLY